MLFLSKVIDSCRARSRYHGWLSTHLHVRYAPLAMLPRATLEAGVQIDSIRVRRIIRGSDVDALHLQYTSSAPPN